MATFTFQLLYFAGVAIAIGFDWNPQWEHVFDAPWDVGLMVGLVCLLHPRTRRSGVGFMLGTVGFVAALFAYYGSVLLVAG